MFNTIRNLIPVIKSLTKFMLSLKLHAVRNKIFPNGVKIIAAVLLICPFNYSTIYAEGAPKDDAKEIEISAEKIKQGTERVIKKTDKGLKKAAEKTGKGIKKAGEKTEKALKRAGKKIKEHVSIEKDEGKKE